MAPFAPPPRIRSYQATYTLPSNPTLVYRRNDRIFKPMIMFLLWQIHNILAVKITLLYVFPGSWKRLARLHKSQVITLQNYLDTWFIRRFVTLDLTTQYFCTELSDCDEDAVLSVIVFASLLQFLSQQKLLQPPKPFRQCNIIQKLRRASGQETWNIYKPSFGHGPLPYFWIPSYSYPCSLEK